MKATFDITIRIDGRKVETAFGMKDGADDVNVNVLQVILKTIQDAQKKISTQVDKFYGVKTSVEEPEEEAEVAEVAEEDDNLKQEGE